MQKGIFSVIGMLTISMGCASHRLTKNADVPNREIASFSGFRPTQVNSSNALAQRAAVTIVGPRGDVMFFVKVRENILIKQCEPYSVVQRQEDCQPREGTQVRQVPVEQFKSHLRNSLLVRSFELSSSQDRAKLDAFREASRNADAGVNLEQLRRERQRIEDFIRFVCGVQQVELESDCAKQNADVARLRTVISTLDRNRGREQVINEINTIINHLVDEVIGRDEITMYRFSDASGTLAYQILRSYVRPSNPEMQYVRIQAGQFTMGSPPNERNRDNDEAQVSVRVSRDFEMQTTEITQLQWWSVMGTKPSFFSQQRFCPDSWMPQEGICPEHPVESVSWNEVRDFITKLNSQDSRYSYRLPTEAEWEYATRAGTQSAYSFGNDEVGLTQFAWFSANSGNQTRQVATKQANPWGLYDVHGNVWEWVQDWYSGSRAGGTDPTGSSSGFFRVIRGGSWNNFARYLRSAYRYYDAPGHRSRILGARLVRTAK